MEDRSMLARRLRPLLGHVRERGVELTTLLRELSIPPSVFFERDQRLDERKELELWRRCLEASGDPDLGVHTLEILDFRVFLIVSLEAEYLLYQAFAASDSAAEGLARLARYYPIVSDSIRVRVASRQPDQVVVRHLFWREQREVGALVEYVVGLAVRALASLASPAIRPIEVSFSHARSGPASEHERIFGCPVRFGSGEDAIVLRASDLDRPLRSANKMLLTEIDRLAAAMLANPPEPSRILDGTRAIIDETLPSGDPGVTSVARQLGMSARTLTRKLAQLGTSYQELLDERRAVFACELIDRGLAPSDVATQLGFSEPSALQRAFKRWFGVSVGEYRRRDSE